MDDITHLFRSNSSQHRHVSKLPMVLPHSIVDRMVKSKISMAAGSIDRIMQWRPLITALQHITMATGTE